MSRKLNLHQFLLPGFGIVLADVVLSAELVFGNCICWRRLLTITFLHFDEVALQFLIH